MSGGVRKKYVFENLQCCEIKKKHKNIDKL